MSITLKIEAEPGSQIEETFEEAIRLATLLTCTTEFKFNEVVCWGRPDGDVKKGVKEYLSAINRDSKYKYASS
jgi:hypothetical protein